MKTNQGKIISSPLSTQAEKKEQNVKLVEGVKRLINHQRRKSSSSSLTLHSWTTAEDMSGLIADGTTKNNSVVVGSHKELTSASLKVVAALSKIDDMEEQRSGDGGEESGGGGGGGDGASLLFVLFVLFVLLLFSGPADISFLFIAFPFYPFL